MSQKSGTAKMSSERTVKDIRRATRKQYSAEEKIRIVLDGLRGEHRIAELCRREGIAESVNAGEILRRLAGVKVQHGRKQDGPYIEGLVACRVSFLRGSVRRWF
jgi:hypothetical protein